MRKWITRRLEREPPDTIEDNDRHGRFWLRGEIPFMATHDFPASSEFLWLHDDQLHNVSGPYKDARFTYKTNSQGWRSREIDLASPSRKIMFVGCSYTMGLGLPYDEVWTSVVTQQIEACLGEPVEQHNFGYPGRGNDFFAMIVHQVLPILKPDLLVVLFTQFARRTLFHRFGRHMAFLPSYVVPDYKAEHEAFIRLQSDTHDFMDFVRQHSLIDATAKLSGIPWAWQTWGRQSLPPLAQLEKYVRIDNMVDSPFPAFGSRATDDVMKSDVARDGSHPGPKANRAFGLATSRFVLDRGLIQKGNPRPPVAGTS
jgi:hypothetical protein